jgi:hypothetical protein
MFTVVNYCSDCDIEWEQDIDPSEREYITTCPECKYESEEEFDPEDYIND